jgi:hypothetical protein
MISHCRVENSSVISIFPCGYPRTTSNVGEALPHHLRLWQRYPCAAPKPRGQRIIRHINSVEGNDGIERVAMPKLDGVGTYRASRHNASR